MSQPTTPSLSRSASEAPNHRRSSSTSAPNVYDRSESTPEHGLNATNGSDERRSRSSSNNSSDSAGSGDANIMRKKGPGMNGTAALFSPLQASDYLKEIQSHDDELTRRRSASVLEVKDHAQTRIRDELHRLQSELNLKNEECKKLERVQDQMGEEVEELTAKLFEEANKMVQDANVRRMHSEKLLKEALSKIEVLQAEVTALKTLVLTSTPSMPNKHLHPQLESKAKKENPVTSTFSFMKGHRRSTSHQSFKRDFTTPPESPATPDVPARRSTEKELEPVYLDQFKKWRASKPTEINLGTPFLMTICNDEIMPCLNFANKQLATEVFDGIIANTLTIEPYADKNPFPKKCALTATSRVCRYRIRTGDSQPWQIISQIARNRVIAVCGFFQYVRYLIQGLVKSDDSDIYWEIIEKRKEICLARLGVS